MMTRQQHALLKLAEEASEVAERALKAMQFGLDEVEPGQPLSNRERLEYEIRDVMSVTVLLVRLKMVATVEFSSMEEHVRAKLEKIERYYQLSQSLGQVE